MLLRLNNSETNTGEMTHELSGAAAALPTETQQN
jgi:hypothetical protein